MISIAVFSKKTNFAVVKFFNMIGLYTRSSKGLKEESIIL